MSRAGVAFGLVIALLAAAVAAVVGLNLRGESPVSGRAADPPSDETRIRRGAYLALAGNCAGCHTERGGAPYAGGAGIATPFGTVFASNLTPDAATGIGDWSASAFWRALHNGRSRDGRLLYPAFPYPNYTRITRDDSDAIHAYLQSLTPVRRPNTPHALRFPYRTQAALAVWRALYFRPHDAPPAGGAGADADRGAYLVNALGHCNACHADRNWLGATRESPDLGGGLIPMQNWYAPSLIAADEASVADWPAADIVALLKAGVAPRASVLGPMADVVFRSTQFLTQADLGAIAAHLKGLPQSPASAPRPPPASVDADARIADGRAVYDAHCSDCHGIEGQGRPGAYPALAGNRAVLLDPPANGVRVLLGGGFPPATAGNPRPYGMPPFATLLSDREVAAVLTMIRNSWGNRASVVDTATVQRYRDGAR